MPQWEAWQLKEWKQQGKRLPALTAYDYSLARFLDDAGIPLILVGDSLGMVILGHEDTTRVTLDHMIHHVGAVSRGCRQALVVADLPIHTYETPEQAVESARALVAAGAGAVKAEGGRSILPQVQAILEGGIPFLGHLGMLPQQVHEEGGYHIKGRTEMERQNLLEDAQALEVAGAFGLVLELVDPEWASMLTKSVSIPTIGIGAGQDCDGQILVTHDLLGWTPGRIPKHVPRLGQARLAQEEVLKLWVRQVEAGQH